MTPSPTSKSFLAGLIVGAATAFALPRLITLAAAFLLGLLVRGWF